MDQLPGPDDAPRFWRGLRNAVLLSIPLWIIIIWAVGCLE